MTTMQDASVGFALEPTYGTETTPSRFPEFVSESLEWKKSVKQSPALRLGRRLPLQRGRVVPTAEGTGDLVIEAASKGQGLLWKLLMGAGASTLVDASTTYQQVFTLADVMPSATVQKVLPDATGAFNPFTFTGVTADSVAIDFANGDIMKITAALNARDLSTVVAAAAPSYIAGDVNLFEFANSAVYSGTLTEPTATALGSAVTELANVRSGSITINHNPMLDRYNVGGGGRKKQPLVAERAVTVKLEMEFDSMAMSQAMLAETPMSLVLNYTGAALSTGVETLQIVIPCLVPETELPKSNGSKLIVQSMTFTGLADLVSSEPIWVILRTSDSAL